LLIGPEEQAERMVLLVAGRLQVHVMSPSERELTLSVLASGSVVVSTGPAPRWARDLRIRALEASVVRRVESAKSRRRWYYAPTRGWGSGSRGCWPLG
jgi:predicted anti-sigma-YlaC factor YlaD